MACRGPFHSEDTAPTRKGVARIGVRICTVQHRDPEESPAHDAEVRYQVHQTLGCSQLCLLSPTAGFHDFVEGFYLLSSCIPVQFSIACLREQKGKSVNSSNRSARDL
jgi:hypothetical protein